MTDLPLEQLGAWLHATPYSWTILAAPIVGFFNARMGWVVVATWIALSYVEAAP